MLSASEFILPARFIRAAQSASAWYFFAILKAFLKSKTKVRSAMRKFEPIFLRKSRPVLAGSGFSCWAYFSAWLAFFYHFPNFSPNKNPSSLNLMPFPPKPKNWKRFINKNWRIWRSWKNQSLSVLSRASCKTGFPLSSVSASLRRDGREWHGVSSLVYSMHRLV